MQEHFRQHYSKFGNTREQLFHLWRSFQYDENTDTIDSYISKIKQVVPLLNHGELQILELFKNTLLSKLYWILFPITSLRDVVDVMKRVLTKKKLDRQLSGQATTPFMKVGDVPHSGKKVSFNVQDPIKEQLGIPTSMVYNMSMQKEENTKPFKPQIYQKRGRGQNRQNFSNRDRCRAFNGDKQRQNFRPNNTGWSQNRQCGNDNRRGNYRHQNYSRNDSRDRGRKQKQRTHTKRNW